jgi:hypothetical protein
MSQAEAKFPARLTTDQVREWYASIVGSHASPLASAPDVLTSLVASWNRRLTLCACSSDVAIVELIADALYDVTATRAFADGRAARLIANYFARRCEVPIVVFRATERDLLRTALADRHATRSWIADKLREAVFSLDGHLLERTATGDAADIYDGLVVERHELLAAQASWGKVAHALHVSRR